MADLGLRALLLADAGLNLNAQAFAALRRAADETGFLTNRALIAEVYPKSLTEEHVRFLERVGAPHIGVGLQSFDDATLRHVERKFDPSRLGGLLDVLRSVASVTTEIIMGLPGDMPDQFLKSFARARALGTGLRVYHCAVLPSALMTRAPASDLMDFDEVSLKMRSCRGWPGDSIDRMARRLNDEAASAGGASGDYFWIFPPA
jgi:coproporphyrinogen III oxidase-like Fe-S oxidoreductase